MTDELQNANHLKSAPAWDWRRILAVALALLGCVGFQWNMQHGQLTMPVL